MVTLFKTMCSASLLGLATSRGWCAKHEASQIWNQTNKPHMLPESWFGELLTGFTQDAMGNRYYAGLFGDPLGFAVNQVVKTSPRNDHASYTIIWAEPMAKPESPVQGLAVSKDGLSLFITIVRSKNGLLECPTFPRVPLGRCETIVATPDGQRMPFSDLVYDDGPRVLYASVPAKNAVMRFGKDENGKWSDQGRAAGNADFRPHSDLTGLYNPRASRIYEGDLYILDVANHRIVRWHPGDGQAKPEPYALDGVSLARSLSVNDGYIYYMDIKAAAVYRRDIANPSKDKELVAGGCGMGTGANQLQGSFCAHLFVEEGGTLIIEEYGRVVAWNVNAILTAYPA